jgi:hypothetical protein
VFAQKPCKGWLLRIPGGVKDQATCFGAVGSICNVDCVVVSLKWKNSNVPMLAVFDI